MPAGEFRSLMAVSGGAIMRPLDAAPDAPERTESK
jgi:hypothetical protein